MIDDKIILIYRDCMAACPPFCWRKLLIGSLSAIFWWEWFFYCHRNEINTELHSKIFCGISILWPNV